MDELTFRSLCKLRHHVCSRTQRGCARLPHHDGEIRIDLPLLFFTSSSHCAQRAVMEIKSKPRGFYGRAGVGIGRSSSRSKSKSGNKSIRSASSGRRERSNSSRQTSKPMEFVPVHTPDRPTHPVTDIPSDEECYAIFSGIQAHNIQVQSQDSGAERRVATWILRGDPALPHAESPTLSPPAQRRSVSTESSGGTMASAAGRTVGINNIMNDFEDRRPKTAPSPRSTTDSAFSSIVPVSPESTYRMQPEVTAWPGSVAANTFQLMRQQLSPSPPESECTPGHAEQQTWSFQETAKSYYDRPGMLPSPAASLSIPPITPALSKQVLSLYNRESVYPDALTPTRWNTVNSGPRSAPPFPGHVMPAAAPPRPSNQTQIACTTNGEQICRLCRRPGMMGGGALCLRCENSYLPVTSGVFGDNTHASPESDQERGRVRRRQDDMDGDNVQEKPFSLGPPPPRRKGLGRTAKPSPRGQRGQREDSSREVSPTPARVGIARGISIKAAMSPRKIQLISPGLRPGDFPGFPRAPGESGGAAKSPPSRDASVMRRAGLASPLRFNEALDPLQRDAAAQGEAHDEDATNREDWTDDWDGFDYYFEPKETSERNEGHLAAAIHRQLSDVDECSSGSEDQDQVPALEPSPISPILSKLRRREEDRTLRSDQPLVRFFRSPEPAFF